MEIWKDIQGYEGYQISNYGRIKSLNYNKTKQEKILKTSKNTKGYLQVGLFKDGKQVRKQIHRLVAEAFLENPNNLPQVNHKDENKENNCAENLEWCTLKYNINYGTGVQRRAEKRRNDPSMSKRVDQIDPQTREVIRQWESTAECGRNGFLSGMVSKCALGKYKQYKGFIWKYVADNKTLKF